MFIKRFSRFVAFILSLILVFNSMLILNTEKTYADEISEESVQKYPFPLTYDASVREVDGLFGYRLVFYAPDSFNGTMEVVLKICNNGFVYSTSGHSGEYLLEEDNGINTYLVTMDAYDDERTFDVFLAMDELGTYTVCDTYVYVSLDDPFVTMHPDYFPMPTVTPTPTEAPAPTLTSTPRPTNTAGPTLTSTPRPTTTAGPTLTSTPRATATPTAQATATPTVSAEKITINGSFWSNDGGTISIVNNDTANVFGDIVIVFEADGSFSDVTTWDTDTVRTVIQGNRLIVMANLGNTSSHTRSFTVSGFFRSMRVVSVTLNGMNISYKANITGIPDVTPTVIPTATPTIAPTNSPTPTDGVTVVPTEFIPSPEPTNMTTPAVQNLEQFMVNVISAYRPGNEIYTEEFYNWYSKLYYGDVSAQEFIRYYCFDNSTVAYMFTDEEFASTLYRAIYGVEPDYSEISSTLQFLGEGNTREDAFNEMTHSSKFIELCQRLNLSYEERAPLAPIDEFIIRAYRQAMMESPSEEFVNSWHSQLINKTASAYDYVISLYRAYNSNLPNTPNDSFIQDMDYIFYDGNMDGNFMMSCYEVLFDQGREAVIAKVSQEESFANYCMTLGIDNYVVGGNPSTPIPSGGTPSPSTPTPAIDAIKDFVSRTYEYALGREADPIGVDYWAEGLQSGDISAAYFITSFTSSMECEDRNLSEEAFCNMTYRILFNRNAEEPEHHAWYERYATQALTREMQINLLCDSDEFKAYCAALGIRPTEDSPYIDPNHPDCVVCTHRFQNDIVPLLTRNGADLNNDGHFTAEELATLTVLRCTTEDCTANLYDVNYGAVWDVISICPNITSLELTITEINSDYETAGISKILDEQIKKLTVIYDSSITEVEDIQLSVQSWTNLEEIEVIADAPMNLIVNILGSNNKLQRVILPDEVEDLTIYIDGCRSLNFISGCKSITGECDFAISNCPLLDESINIKTYDPSRAQTMFVPNNKVGADSFIVRLYSLALGRDIEMGGFMFWSNAARSGSVSGADIATSFLFSPEFLSNGMTNEEFIDTLYLIFFDHPSEPSGKAYWLSLLAGGTSRLEIINSFIETPEWVSVCREYGIRSGATIEDSVPQADVGDFIERLYQNILGRHSDEGGMQSWRQAAASGATGADIAAGFLYSPEFLNKPISNAEFIRILYRVFFDREADEGGLAYWEGLLNNGTSRRDAIVGFINSNEWADVCATYGIPSGGTGVASK